MSFWAPSSRRLTICEREERRASVRARAVPFCGSAARARLASWKASIVSFSRAVSPVFSSILSVAAFDRARVSSTKETRAACVSSASFCTSGFFGSIRTAFCTARHRR